MASLLRASRGGRILKARAFAHGARMLHRSTRRVAAGDNRPSTPRLPTPWPQPREVFIQGLTRDGKTFRPSDWAERLAGAMSCFRPEGSAAASAAFIGYSPYCVPRVVDGVKGVIVNEALRELEPMAWDFVMNFARDNDLRRRSSAGSRRR